jgi:hypothetical protein
MDGTVEIKLDLFKLAQTYGIELDYAILETAVEPEDTRLSLIGRRVR